MSELPKDATQLDQVLTELAEPNEDVRIVLASLQLLKPDQAPAQSIRLQNALQNRSMDVGSSGTRRHTSTIFTLALFGALAAGTGTAAAVSPAFRDGATHTIIGILHALPGIPHPEAPATPKTSIVHSPKPNPHATNSTHGEIGAPASSHPRPPQANPKSTSHPRASTNPSPHGKGKP